MKKSINTSSNSLNFIPVLLKPEKMKNFQSSSREEHINSMPSNNNQSNSMKSSPMTSRNNQPISMSEFTPSSIIFSEPKEKMDKAGAFPHRQVDLSVRNPDGSIGDRLLETTDDLFSFGVQADVYLNKMTGYNMCINLFNEPPTEEEKEWYDKWNDTIDFIKNHLVDIRGSLKKWELELSDLKKLNPVYWKRKDDGTLDPRGPKLYPKLISYPKKDSPGEFDIKTTIYDSNTDMPLSLPEGASGRCVINKAIIKLESIFIGTDKFSLRVKLIEAIVTMTEGSGTKRLLMNKKKSPKAKESAYTPAGDDDLYVEDDD